jgi:hypothetical protein
MPVITRSNQHEIFASEGVLSVEKTRGPAVSLSKNIESKAPVIFVAGFYRSGTSLLYACLNRHPDIAILYEAEILSVALPPRLRYHRKWVESCDMWANFIRRHHLDELPEEKRDSLRSAADVYAQFARRKGAIYGGEKSPPFSYMLPQLVSEFPNCRIITLTRDPVETYSSILRAASYDNHFGKRGMLERLVYGHEKMVQDSMELKRQGHELLHLNYRDLVENLEEECRRICLFLGIPYAPEMAEPSKADLSAVHAAPHHEKLRNGKVCLPGASKIDVLVPRVREKLQRLNLRWSRLHHTMLSGEELPPGAEELPQDEVDEMYQAGEKNVVADRRKRAFYHLLPVDSVGLYRGIKLFLGEIKTEERRRKTDHKRARDFVKAWMLAAIFAAFALAIMQGTAGQASSMLFWLAVPIVVAWFTSLRQAVVAATLAVILWSFSRAFTPNQPDTWFPFVWNGFSRFSVMLALSFLTVHLRHIVWKYKLEY